jgi:hypothetical protein
MTTSNPISTRRFARSCGISAMRTCAFTGSSKVLAITSAST